jgi:hypothetical protein
VIFRSVKNTTNENAGSGQVADFLRLFLIETFPRLARQDARCPTAKMAVLLKIYVPPSLQDRSRFKRKARSDLVSASSKDLRKCSAATFLWFNWDSNSPRTA